MRQYHFPAPQIHPIRSRVYHLGSLHLTPCHVAPRTPEPEVGRSSRPRRATILSLSTKVVIGHVPPSRISEHFGTASPLDFRLLAAAIRATPELGMR